MVCSAPSWSRSAGRIGAAVVRRLNWRSGGSDEIDLFTAVLGAASPSSPDLSNENYRLLIGFKNPYTRDGPRIPQPFASMTPRVCRRIVL